MQVVSEFSYEALLKEGWCLTLEEVKEEKVDAPKTIEVEAKTIEAKLDTKIEAKAAKIKAAEAIAKTKEKEEIPKITKE
jgi:nitrogen fixation protein